MAYADTQFIPMKAPIQCHMTWLFLELNKFFFYFQHDIHMLVKEYKYIHLPKNLVKSDQI
jgi:hypothetical protein